MTDWPATVQMPPPPCIISSRRPTASPFPPAPIWQPSLSFAEDGDQAFETVHLNGTNGLAGLHSTDAFMNIADTNFTAWAGEPVLDILVQVYGNEKLYDADGNDREVIFRTGSLGHTENPVSAGPIPSGINKGEWNWVLFTIPNAVNPATGKQALMATICPIPTIPASKTAASAHWHPPS